MSATLPELLALVCMIHGSESALAITAVAVIDPECAMELSKAALDPGFVQAKRIAEKSERLNEY